MLQQEPTQGQDVHAAIDEQVARDHPDVKWAGCLAHVRRRFLEALEAGDLRASIAIAIIRDLYQVESEATAAGDSPEARLERRQKYSVPSRAPPPSGGPGSLTPRYPSRQDPVWDVRCRGRGGAGGTVMSGPCRVQAAGGADGPGTGTGGPPLEHPGARAACHRAVERLIRGRGTERLLFYPSCGSRRLWTLFGLGYDGLVFCDFAPRDAEEAGDFWSRAVVDAAEHGCAFELEEEAPAWRAFRCGRASALLLFLHNRDVLAALEEAGARIHGFVGVNDGCGTPRGPGLPTPNDECTNGLPFLTRVLRLAAPVMRYYTDHSEPLCEGRIEHVRRMWGAVPTSQRFRKQLTVLDRWDLTLDGVLALHPGADLAQMSPFARLLAGRGEERPEDFEVFFPSSAGRKSAWGDCRELRCFVPFRLDGYGMIASYDARDTSIVPGPVRGCRCAVCGWRRR